MSGDKVLLSTGRVRYRESSWRVHDFEVCNGVGETLYKVVALRMNGALLLWTGSVGPPRFTDLAAGMPCASTALLGTGAWAGAMARRLAARLNRPVFVSCGEEFDRLMAPLLERAILTEMKNRPHCF